MLNFIFYMGFLAAFWVIALALYTRVTPYDELKLAKEGNVAASLCFIGTALGLALPLASLAVHAVSFADMALWSGVAWGVQVISWFVLSRVFFKNLKNDIEANRVSVGVLVAGANVCVGILNAASMSY